MSCLVPKLCLQPLVENAIVHGAADREEGYVKIWAAEEAGELLLYVSDNGPGMPPEVLSALAAGAAGRQDRLGLFNVDSILRLHYGAGYGLSAWNLPEEGCCVRLRLPARREENGDAEGTDR